MTDGVTGAVSDEALPCLECGYDLRGLDAHGSCPECGELIALSTRGNALRNADPLYLTRAHIAAILLAATFAVGACVRIERMIGLGLPGLVLIRISTFCELFPLIASVLLASRDATAQRRDWPNRSQIVVMLAIVHIAAYLAVVYATVDAGPYRLLSAFALMGWYVAIFSILRDLAERANDPTLKRHNPVVLWSLVGAAALGELLPEVILLLNWGGFVLPTVPLAGRHFLLLVADAYAAWLLWRYRAMLAGVTHEARENWGMHSSQQKLDP